MANICGINDSQCCNDENGYCKSDESSSHSSPSLLRVLCLHDARSNALELSRKLDALGERLYRNHAIDLVFVDGPLVVEKIETVTTATDEKSFRNQPLRVWWEEETRSLKTMADETDTGEAVGLGYGKTVGSAVVAVGRAVGGTVGSGVVGSSVGAHDGRAVDGRGGDEAEGSGQRASVGGLGRVRGLGGNPLEIALAAL